MQRAVGALRTAGLLVIPVPVDAEGLTVEALPPGLAAVFVTPAHQFPLAVRMPATRRVALVQRARAEGFLIVEDDYDGELRYDVAPLPLLAALGPDVVVHLGTLSAVVRHDRQRSTSLSERVGTRPGRGGLRLRRAADGGQLSPGAAV